MSLSSSSWESMGEVSLMSVDDVQRLLNRSRPSIYRYTNTDPKGQQLNMPYDPDLLNPEHRTKFREPLQFHPTEVARFARDVLKIKEVQIEVLPSPHRETTAILQAILEELKEIRSLLSRSRSD